MRSWLSPIGQLYGCATSLRQQLYEKKILPSVRLSKPVVSVGNLTVGGTGKTPVVDAILSQLEQRGRVAYVLTRGYGRTQIKSQIVTSTSLPTEVGDEPLWLAKRHPQHKVIVGADRVRSARLLESPDLYILDDGFQHQRICRDLDIVLVDATRPSWHYLPLPRGYGRESLSAIGRAHLLIVTRSNQVDPSTLNQLNQRLLKLTTATSFTSTLGFGDFQQVWGNAIWASNHRFNEKVYLVSGIGHPESYKQLVHASGIWVAGHRIFPDHHSYKFSDLEMMAKEARAMGAEVILTTSKDAIKWTAFQNPDPHLKWVQANLELDFKPALPDIYELASQRCH